MAKVIITQLGGADGETGAAMRYLHQRYSCPYGEVTGILTDIGMSVIKMPQFQKGRTSLAMTANF